MAMSKTIARKRYADGTGDRRENETILGNKRVRNTGKINGHSSDRIDFWTSSKGGM